MVFRQGIEVSVIDVEGNPFIEYGEQRITRQTQSSKIVSTKIEAKTGKAFYILIKPQNPFPVRQDEAGVKGRIFNNLTPRSKKRANSQPVYPEALEEGAEEASTMQAPRSATTSPKSKAPPFQLSAYVYIDGNVKPESRTIIWLDPQDDKTWKPNGVKLTGRWETKKEASSKKSIYQPIQALAWVFNPYGSLDYWLGKLNVNGADPIIPTTADEIDDNEIADRMSGSKLEEKSAPKKGVIKVVIKRIRVEGPSKSTTAADQYAHRQGEKEVDGETAPTNDWLTHETGVERTKAQDLRLHVMAWSKFDPAEDFYAEFQFQYMGRDKLVKLGVSEMDGTPRRAGSTPAATSQEGAEPVAEKRRASSDEDEASNKLPSKKSTSLFNSKVRSRAQAKAEKERVASAVKTCSEWRGSEEVKESDESAGDD